MLPNIQRVLLEVLDLPDGPLGLAIHPIPLPFPNRRDASIIPTGHPGP